VSLCPDYCECKPCRHGIASCSYIPCRECAAEAALRLQQDAHEDSVRRQRNRLRPMPWVKVSASAPPAPGPQKGKQ